MNAATIACGLLLAAGSVLLRPVLSPGRRGWLFVGLMLAAGASWCGAGWVAVDEDLALHVLLALPAFAAQNLALLCVTHGQPCRRWRGAARWVGIAGLGATLLSLLAQAWGLPLGLIERLALYPSVIWMSGLGSCLLFGGRHATDR